MIEDVIARERAGIAKLFSEEIELELYDLTSKATYRVSSVDGTPPKHKILVSYYDNEAYLSPENRSNTNRLTVMDLDYDVRYGQVVNHANISMRVQDTGKEVMRYDQSTVILSDTKVSLRDLLARAYQLGGYGERHNLLNSNGITEKRARMLAAEVIGVPITLDTPEVVEEALLHDKGIYNPESARHAVKNEESVNLTCLDMALTDYERYQLEWMIEHGHSLKELMEELTLYQNELELTPGVNLTVHEVFNEWVDDHGFGGEVFASEAEWREAEGNYRKAPKEETNMDENGNLDKQTVETWKERNVLIDRSGDDALVMRRMADGRREYVVAYGYNEETGHWGQGTYYDSLASAAADLEGRAISDAGEEVICPDFWYRADIESALEYAGLEVNDENVDATLEALELYGDNWYSSNFHDRLAEMGNEMIADAVDDIGPNGGDGDSPEAFVDRGISLKTEAESGIVGRGNLMDVSGEISLAETMSSLKSDEPAPEAPLNTDNVRDWYMHAFPKDELGSRISPELTFDAALGAVPRGTGFYDALGVGDSVVRERVFEELAQRNELAYGDVYGAWLDGKPVKGNGLLDTVYGHGIYDELAGDREACGISLKGEADASRRAADRLSEDAGAEEPKKTESR